MSASRKSWFRQLIIFNTFVLLFFPIFSLHAAAADGSEQTVNPEQEKVKVSEAVYVSPDGSDITGKGKKNSPFQTLAKARDEVRAYMADASNTPNGLKGDIIVYLRGGTYFQDNTLEFGPEDSGINGYNVIYQAYPGETPVISGGQPITGWQSVADGVYKAPVGSLDFRQLYINDTRGIRARTPNVGSYFRLKSYDNTNKTIHINRSEAEGLEGGLGSAEMIVQTHWADRHLMVQSVQLGDTDATITPAEPERSQVIGNEAPKSEANQSYHFENKRAFLDQEGEWFLDTANHELYYKPRPGEDLSSAVVIAPLLETVVRLKGTVDNPVHNIQFQGLRFEHSTWLKPNDGYAGVQATYYTEDDLWYGGKLPGAVQLEAAGNIRFERNTFTHLGATGLDLEYGNFDNTIEGNVFTDISGNGLAAASKLYTVTAIPDDPLMIDRRIHIQNNYISKIGQDYYGAVGIFGGYVEGLTVEHNEITDLPYSGISVGWGFTKTATVLKDNIIRYNRISNVMNLMDDGGGIYTLSYQPGTEIEENYIHDVVRSPWTTNNSPDKEYWRNLGIYLDNSSSGMTVMNNVIHNTERIIKTNVEPYGTNTFIRNYNDLQWVKDNAGLEPAYQDIRLTAPTDPPTAEPDAAPPTLLSASTDETGQEILLQFNEPLESVSDTGILDASRFSLNGTTAVVSSAVMEYADVKNARVKLTLDKSAGYGRTVTLAMAEGAVKDVALNSIEQVDGFSVDNHTLIPYLMKVSMVGSPILHVGESAQIKVALTTRDGQPVDLSQTAAVYSSADSSIAAVNSGNGVITGIKAGETKVDVSVMIDEVDVRTSVNILVVPTTGPKPELINIAKGRPAEATSQYSNSYSAAKSNDDNINTAWITAGTGSLTIDLGEQADLYRMQRIEVATRLDADQASTRRNFEVWASDDPKFVTHTVLGSQGGTSLNYRATWSVDLTDSSSYRYIRFVKPVDYAAVAELRVLASPISPPDEISDVAIIPGDGQLQAVWDESSEVSAVNIYEGEATGNGVLAQSIPKGVKTAVITGLTNGTPYTFTFRTVNAEGKESFGKSITGTPSALINIALGKPATATDEVSGSYNASKANDSSMDTSWVSNGAASWTVDLGSGYNNNVIRRIEVVTRQDADEPQTRRNFEVRASNDPAFATYTVLGSQGDETLLYKATWSADVAGTNSYRYVRFVSLADIAAVAELRVLAAPTVSPKEVVDAKSYTADGELILTWNEPVDSAISGINIYNGNTVVQSVYGGVGTARITGLTNGTPYTFTIRTVGTLGNESPGVDVTGTPKVLQNIALGKLATATSEYSSSYAAGKANDNTVGTTWITKGTASWTVDLGEAYNGYRVRKIEAATRFDADQPSTRRNFEVRASNDPAFATYTVLGSQGNESLPYKATWSAYVLDETPYRYIRFVKPIDFAAVSELRVFAEPISQ